MLGPAPPAATRRASADGTLNAPLHKETDGEIRALSILLPPSPPLGLAPPRPPAGGHVRPGRPRRCRRLDTAASTPPWPRATTLRLCHGSWLKAPRSRGQSQLWRQQHPHRPDATADDRAHPGRRPAGAGASAETQKVAHFYASFMTRPASEARGLTPLKPALDAIRKSPIAAAWRRPRRTIRRTSTR